MAEEGPNGEQPAFWVFLEDHEVKLFSVLRPLSDDSGWSVRIRDARRHGRDVTISTVASELDVSAMRRSLMTHGFRESGRPILSL
jgi:hypothetical protein